METNQRTLSRGPGIVWSELHHTLVADTRGEIKRSLNSDAVRSSIDNILNTSPMERVMLPNFACRLRDLVFEPALELLANNIATEVRENIERWDDRVTINSFTFRAIPDRNEVAVDVSFLIRGHDRVFEHVTNISARGD